MPIMIRELIIKARIDPQGSSSAPVDSKTGEDCTCDHAVDLDQLSRILADREER